MSENIDSWDAHHKFLTFSETFYGAFFLDIYSKDEAHAFMVNNHS